MAARRRLTLTSALLCVDTRSAWRLRVRSHRVDAGRQAMQGVGDAALDGLVDAIVLIGGFLIVVWGLRRLNGAGRPILPPRDDIG